MEPRTPLRLRRARVRVSNLFHIVGLLAILAPAIGRSSVAFAATSTPSGTSNGHYVFAQSERPNCPFEPRGHLRCDSHVITDAQGIPLGTSGPAAGSYGPSTFQSAYNLPNWKANPLALPAALNGFAYASTSNYVYIFGGYSGSGPVSTVYSAQLRLDGSLGLWTQVANSLPAPRFQAQAIYANGYVFVIGGNNGTVTVDTIYSAPVLSFGSLGPWTKLNPGLPQPLSQHTAVVANGHVIVVGGNDPTANPASQGTIYSAIINTNGTLGSWFTQYFGGPPGSLRQHSAVVSGNHLLLIGGYDTSGTPSKAVYTAPINTDGTIGLVSSTTALPVASGSGLVNAAGVAYNNYVLVAGGNTSGTSAGTVSTVYAARVNADGTVGSWLSSWYSLPFSTEGQGVLAGAGIIQVLGGLVGGSSSDTIWQIPFPVVTGTVASGNPATVAIVTANDDPTAEADLQAYRSQYGLPACTSANLCFKKIDQIGGTSYPSADTGHATETALDMDMVSATCPNCHILLVEAATTLQQDESVAINTAATYGSTKGDTNFTAAAVSMSYSETEYCDILDCEKNYDSKYYHPGTPIVVSTGDYGYCTQGTACPLGAGTQYPAASPNVVAVGGTYLSSSTSSRGWSEVAWNVTYGRTNYATASGCSLFEAKPVWQTRITDQACSNRMIADVSAVADGPNHIASYDSYNQKSPWLVEFGTSAAAPLVAAASALAGTAASNQFASALYSNRGWLFDIASGNTVTKYGNCGTSTSSTYYYCTSVAGYDGPTGLGTPNGVMAFGPPANTALQCPSAAPTLAASSAHSLVANNTGGSYGFGHNSNGQLGNGTTDYSDGLGPVSNVSHVFTLATGAEHSLFVETNGNIWATGDNTYGELGNGTSTSSTVPIQVPGLNNVTMVSAAKSGLHSLALANGVNGPVLWAWGYNAQGELGNNSTSNSNVPIQVQGPGGTGLLSNITQISAGGSHSMALRSDGTVWTWGSDSDGQLGNGQVALNAYAPTPIEVLGPGGTGYLSKVTMISGGGDFSMALRADGTVWEWGINNNGRLGQGSINSTFFTTPVEVLSPSGTGYLTGIAAIAAGGNFAMALKNDGTVWAWGSNDGGQLGVGNSVGPSGSGLPVEVQGPNYQGILSGVTEIIAGGGHALALRNDGTLWGWGNNNDDQVGNPSNSFNVTQVLGSPGQQYLLDAAQPGFC